MKPILSLRKKAKPIKKQYALSNRANPTTSEKKLWQELRGKKLEVKFRQQAIILGWIVDFYCPSQRLVIEVDGEDHQLIDRIAKDAERDRIMESKGLRILRISNSRVINDMPGVLNEIRETFK